MPIFTLEAFEAEQGDCFLLHFGSTDSPRFVLVDGGPGRDVYDQRLRPRLADLAQRFGSLALPLVVCSHIDSDHIGGIVTLFEEVTYGTPPAKIDCLWHNRPLDLVGEQDAQRFAAIVRTDNENERYATESSRFFSSHNWEADAAFQHVVASVEEGDELYHGAQESGIPINCGFDGLVMAPTPDAGYATYKIGELTLTAVGPDAEQIDALRRKWQKETKEHDLEGLLARSEKIAAVVAADDDTSVTNLSSIVFIADYAGRSILMTGDARGDYIRDGLERAGRVKDGQAHVDVLKLQHHGSARNTGVAFFESVIADDYVISANGMYGNPDDATIDALVTARGQEGYRVWLTNGDKGSNLAGKVAMWRFMYPNLKLITRPLNVNSQLIDVADTVTY